MVQVNKYYSYASNTKKGEVWINSLSFRVNRKFPTGNFCPTGISGSERSGENLAKDQIVLVLEVAGNSSRKFQTGNFWPAGNFRSERRIAKTAKDQSVLVLDPAGNSQPEISGNRNFRFKLEPEFPVHFCTPTVGFREGL